LGKYNLLLFDERFFKNWNKCIFKIITVLIFDPQQAFGTTGAFADRLCVATNGDYNQLVSAEELAFCCHTCGFGCNGGYPIKAWEYFKRHGVVSGGNYNTTDVIYITD